MTVALRSELRKLFTLRLWWLMPLVTAGYMAFIAGIMAFSLGYANQQAEEGGAAPNGGLGTTGPLSDIDLALSVYTLAPSLGYVFPALLGAFVVTGEFRHRTITPTLLVEPRRGMVLGAKLVAVIPFGLLVALAATVATVAVGGGGLAILGAPTMLGDPQVTRAILSSVLALTLWSLVGVGFGAVLTNQVAAIVVLLAFTQFVEPVLRLVLAQFDATEELAKFLPGAAGEAITGSSFYQTAGLAGLLTAWQGTLVLLGYAVVLVLVGRVTTFRRDIG